MQNLDDKLGGVFFNELGHLISYVYCTEYSFKTST